MTRILCQPLWTSGHRVAVDLLWEPRDLWWGVFWSHEITRARRHCLRLYICLLPCLPLRVLVLLWAARCTPRHDDDYGEDDHA